MTGAGEILLIACYELGHQPLAVAWPAAALERAGYAPAVLDVSVEPFDAERAQRARLVAISVPMHTALRLGVKVATRVRAVNPTGHIPFGDPDLLTGPRPALAVARALHAEFPDVTFDITAKVEHLLARRGDLPELAALGCLFIVSAVESLSDTVLAHLDKGHTAVDIS